MSNTSSLHNFIKACQTRQIDPQTFCNLGIPSNTITTYLLQTKHPNLAHFRKKHPEHFI